MRSCCNLREVFLGLSIDKQRFLCYSPAVKNQCVNNNLREENLAREHTLKGTLLVAGI